MRAEAIGYDIHITRRKSLADEPGPDDITTAQWLTVVADDPRLCPEEGAPRTINLVGADGCFWYDQGEVLTKHPDAETLTHAHLIAARLRAKVQGDDGEVYLPNGDIVRDVEARFVSAYPRWLPYLGLAAISSFIVVLIHILS